MYIYKITVNDECIYIGSTCNMKMRKHAHEQHRKQAKYNHMTLYKYLNDRNLTRNEIKYEVVEDFDTTDKTYQRFKEQGYINQYHPICNMYNSMKLRDYDYYRNNNIYE